MQYPTLNAGRTDMLVAQLIAGEPVAAEAVATWKGSGESIDFDDFDEMLDEVREEWAERREGSAKFDKDKDRFEGELAVLIFPFLSSIPIPVLDDPGFWRFLAVSRFWWFISWREDTAVANGNVRTYTSSQRNTEQIPLRLFLRAKALGSSDEMALASSLKKSTDFWRSHVIRVRTGTAPAVTRAFAEMQLDEESRLKTGPLRSYARKLNRTWTNVNLALLDDAEAKALIDELKE